MDALLDLLIGFIIGLFWGVCIGIDLHRWALKRYLKRVKG